MKYLVLFLNFFLMLVSCKSKHNIGYSTSFSSVKFDTLLQDKISIRAIVIDNDNVWYGADNNRFGCIDLKTGINKQQIVTNKSLKLEFRSIAQNKENIFLLSVANPALLYKVSKKDTKLSLVYQESHKDVFYDSMQFWNDKEGIAIGDPIGDTFSIIITQDGGNSWQKISPKKLPKILKGEAAFAASNTNIVIKDDETWVVSGGKEARVFHSSDKGKSWRVVRTPIIQGNKMTGIFTADFYDTKNGFIAGGDYEKPQQNFGNKAITVDGGKTWQLVAENQGYGYASCVQYVPNSGGKKIAVVGKSGLFVSFDSGRNWRQFLQDDELYTIRFINETTAIAAGKNKIIQVHFTK